ncbi:hypothetical protein [Brevundimonas subvibrioides]|uniref:Lipoprotein n=1 Tax=Brevundimonas subvibrioides (strain ATCC 15264 / DSM 4735 / LMG 14903 / NBRC 16000 / CB 81) TaxID=633149 RepID=D9QHZ9_BRESC|nr:hypothetical protein [Brevundimonas subvibrioides]ADL01257.1 hypothetical protein Bresu_1946 [Brevundimonas subvibrioides ATCC 15264]
MIRMVALSITAIALTGCLPPAYEAEPASVYQWQRRQEGIERQEAERVRLCAIMNTDTDRYRRDCRRPGDPIR